MEFLELFKTKIFSLISDMILVSFFIAIIGSLFTEAVKISYEKVFIKKNMSSLFTWIVNISMITALSVLFVFAFKIENMLFYIPILNIFSWGLSVLTYNFLIKIMVNVINYVSNLIKEKVMESQSNIIATSLTLKKNEELLSKELNIKDMEKIKE